MYANNLMEKAHLISNVNVLYVFQNVNTLRYLILYWKHHEDFDWNAPSQSCYIRTMDISWLGTITTFQLQKFWWALTELYPLPSASFSTPLEVSTKSNSRSLRGGTRAEVKQPRTDHLQPTSRCYGKLQVTVELGSDMITDNLPLAKLRFWSLLQHNEIQSTVGGRVWKMVSFCGEHGNFLPRLFTLKLSHTQRAYLIPVYATFKSAGNSFQPTHF